MVSWTNRNASGGAAKRIRAAPDRIAAAGGIDLGLDDRHPVGPSKQRSIGDAASVARRLADELAVIAASTTVWATGALLTSRRAR